MSLCRGGASSSRGPRKRGRGEIRLSRLSSAFAGRSRGPLLTTLLYAGWPFLPSCSFATAYAPPLTSSLSPDADPRFPTFFWYHTTASFTLEAIYMSPLLAWGILLCNHMEGGGQTQTEVRRHRPRAQTPPSLARSSRAALPLCRGTLLRPTSFRPGSPFPPRAASGPGWMSPAARRLLPGGSSGSPFGKRPRRAPLAARPPDHGSSSTRLRL